MSVYENVKFGKAVGDLVVSSTELVFKTADNTLKLSLAHVAKHQTAPHKALLKLIMNNGQQNKQFQMSNKEELGRISEQLQSLAKIKDRSSSSGRSSSRSAPEYAPPLPSAPTLDAITVKLPDPIAAPIFHLPKWDNNKEPTGMTRLRSGESFFDGVRRVAERIGGRSPISKGCNSSLPGQRVSDDQVGISLSNGAVRLRPPGAYRTASINPWKMSGAVVPITREQGVEFDPLKLAANKNPRLRQRQLGQTYRQVYLQAHQIGVFDDQNGTRMVSQGTYVYDPDTELRGVIQLDRLSPVIVERETEDTATATGASGVTKDQHGRIKPQNRSHGTTIKITKRMIPSGYVAHVAGITIARPEKGFVVLHKDANNVISMGENLCCAQGDQTFVRKVKDDGTSNLEIEFGDMNHYAKSTPVLTLSSLDSMDALCRAQIKWAQSRPDVWVGKRGAFVDPFDMLEEKCVNMMRDWLLSVNHEDALAEKAKGFTRVEHQWMRELGDFCHEYGVDVLALEITTLRFPTLDAQDTEMAAQRADTNLAIELSRQSAAKEEETSKLNQATHVREQQDKDREAEAEERKQQVQSRINTAEAETITKKVEMDRKVVDAQKALALAEEDKRKAVALAKAKAQAEAQRVKAEGERDAARLAAEGEIAATKEKNQAQLEFLQQQAILLKGNPGLVDLLRIQNDLLKTEALAMAAQTNPNVVLLTGQEALEARRMNKGHAPQVPGSAIMTA